MFNDMDWTRRGKSEQCFSNSEQVKNYAKKFSQVHWTFLGLGSEKKWYGNTSYFLKGKWQATANLVVERFEESGHPVFESVSPLARGILRRTSDTETIHFTAEASNTELSCQTVHSANQFGICGAVASWCKNVGLKPDEKHPKTVNYNKGVQRKGVTSLVNAPRNEEPAAGHILREVQQNFETLETDVQFTKKKCKEAAFIHEVAVGRFYRTAVDVDDGFGDRTSTCRQYTGLRADSDSSIFAASLRRTRIGPVLQVHNIKCLDICGIDTIHDVTQRDFMGNHLPRTNEKSPRGRVTSSRTRTQSHKKGITSRGRELLQKKPNLLLQRKTNPASRKLTTQERVPANPVYCVEETSLMGERTWIDILANKWYQEDALSTEISKLVMRWRRRDGQDEREIDGLFIGIRWDQFFEIRS